MQQLIHGIKINAVELSVQLDFKQTERIIHRCSVLYVTAMNLLVKIMAGRQSDHEELVNVDTQYLPLDLVNIFLLDFVKLSTKHKHRLRSSFRDAFVKEISRHHKDLIRITSHEVPLLFQLSRPMATCNMF